MWSWRCGLGATLVTFAVQYVGPVVRVRNECEPRDAPAWVGPVLAAGLPLYWVSDSPWISAVSSLTPFVEAPVRWWALLADATFGGVAFAVVARARKSRTRQST
ncbi:hypothetical protein [Rubrivirga marina]|uniref:Uncharacterized protein n=1 Tax=Rubrivirga marina TaxID=1196024 RepID=A0A271IYS9_9BACT|nr:hypothetical protein [Rubrivirga marina]PAP75669.1 hypothetical protein BSZ37_04075 [Rubrivirga marina]